MAKEVDIFHSEIPQVMGILNVTPDSFYDGGKFEEEGSIQLQVTSMLEEGVNIIDVGGMSSRPGATIIDEQEEVERVVKGISIIRQLSKDIAISVDTLRVSVAEKALKAGANIVNDISGGEYDSNMFSFVAANDIPYCMMHMIGTPATMQQNVTYENLVQDIYQYFEKKINIFSQLGFNKVIIDPGFGFSKTLDQNYELLHQLSIFQDLNAPILVGISRKSMIYKYLNISPEEALNGSTVLHTFALTKGASILRVHDIKEAVQTVKLFTKTNTL